MNPTRRDVSRTLIVLFCTALMNTSAAVERVASLNLCTDSMVLELVPPNEIVSLTRLARDPALSALADRAHGFDFNHGLAEEIIARAPTLVVSNDISIAVNALLTRLGYRVESFPTAATITQFRQNFLHLAELTHNLPRAHTLLEKMDSKLRTVTTAIGDQKDALLIEAAGYVPGPDSLADDLITAAGLHNAASDYGLTHGGFVRLEQFVQHVPTWLLINEADPHHPAMASNFLQHPALQHALASTHVIVVPEARWLCGGTYFADAVVELNAQLIAALPH